MAATVSVESPDREDTASGLLAALVDSNAIVLRGHAPLQRPHLTAAAGA